MNEVIKEFLVGLGFKVDNSSLNTFNKKLNDTSHQVESFTSSIMKISAAIGGINFLKGFLDTAATFEKYESVLSTIEGSAEKGKASLEWVSDFATTTPYELDEVTQSFVKLKSYGLDPMNGLLKTLGDTSAAMGKPLMQAVEAVSDAVNGENERLKEFGITAAVAGDRITYSYVQNGKTITKAVSKSNKQMIQSTLEGIWNEKYAGAMDKLSSTWIGMWSNLMDTYTRFRQKVMSSKVFEGLKKKLSEVLDSFKKASENKMFDRVAERIGRVISSVGTILSQLYPIIKPFIVLATGVALAIEDAVNGLAMLGDETNGISTIILAAAIAFKALNLALLASPIGIMLALISAVGLLYDDFMVWKEGGDSLIDWSKWAPGIEAGLSAISSFIDAVITLATSVGDLIGAFVKLFSGDFAGFFNQMSKFGNGLIDTFKKLWDTISGLGSAASKIGSVVGDIFGGSPSAPAPQARAAVSGNIANVNQATNITVSGGQNPQATAQAIASKQKDVNASMARNVRGAAI